MPKCLGSEQTLDLLGVDDDEGNRDKAVVDSVVEVEVTGMKSGSKVEIS